MFKTTEEMIMAVFNAMPYSSQIKDLSIKSDHIRFQWRGKVYKVTLNGGVDQVQGGILAGTDEAILIQHILKKYWESTLSC